MGERKMFHEQLNSDGLIHCVLPVMLWWGRICRPRICRLCERLTSAMRMNRGCCP